MTCSRQYYTIPYSYIRVLPDKFLLKSVVFIKFISKEISRAEHELYMNIQPPPPPPP